MQHCKYSNVILYEALDNIVNNECIKRKHEYETQNEYYYY